jgi:hypothetical protein
MLTRRDFAGFASCAVCGSPGVGVSTRQIVDDRLGTQPAPFAFPVDAPHDSG